MTFTRIVCIKLCHGWKRGIANFVIFGVAFLLPARSTDSAAKVIIITTPIGRSVINAPGTWFERFLGLAGVLSRQTPSLSLSKLNRISWELDITLCDSIIYILYVSVIIANRTDEIVQFLVEGVSTPSTEKGVCYRSCAETWSQITSKFMVCLWEILSNSFKAAARHVVQHDRCLESEQRMSRAMIHLLSLSLPSKSSPCVFVSMQFVGWPTLLFSPLTFCEVDSLYLPSTEPF